jgi:hypothetical protein
METQRGISLDQARASPTTNSLIGLDMNIVEWGRPATHCQPLTRHTVAAPAPCPPPYLPPCISAYALRSLVVARQAAAEVPAF